MYRALLQAQWPTSAPPLIAATLLAFATPFIQLITGAALSSQGDPGDAGMILVGQMSIAPLYPLIAWFLGLLMATASWRDDTAGKHIYALILPVPRWYYLLLRLSTGLTFLALPALALAIAALIVSALVTLPPGLHAYPGGLTVRFALASALGFTTFFAMGSANERTARRGLIAFVVAIAILLAAGAAGFERGIEEFFGALGSWPSLVDTFTGRWLLFDV